MDTINRLLSLELPAGQSAFLWGPRKTGQTGIDIMPWRVFLQKLLDDEIIY